MSAERSASASAGAPSNSLFLWRYFRRYIPWSVLALTAIVAYGLASAAMVSMIGPVFSEVLLTDRGAGSVIGIPDTTERDTAGGLPEELSAIDLKGWLNEGYESLKVRLAIDESNVVFYLPTLLLVVLFVRSLAGFVSGYSFQHIGLRMTTDMRDDLFRTIVGQSSRFHARHSSSELVSRVVNDVNVMQSAISTRILDLFQQSATLFFLILLLLSTHFRLALLCLVAAPLFLFSIVRFGKGMRKTSHRSQERMADLTQLLSEATRGHRVVQAFDMEEFEFRRFRAATQKHLRVRLRSQILNYASGPVIEALAAVGSAAFLIFAGQSIRAGTLDAATLVQFMVNLLLLYDPIRKLNKVNLMVQEALAAVSRVAAIVSEPNQIRERPGAKVIDEVQESIEFRSVTFAYRHEPVLHGIDLRIGRSETVALVGSSGAGKSTLVGLLPRFFDPDSGSVTIDGVDIRDVTLKSLRELIGLVSQETVLFDDTIRNNIAYGRSDLPLATVRHAAEAAFADEFIMQLPEGYDTNIGESGSELSGGQRQRLAIARALLKNAPVLILDEATSHLDSESEQLVQKALSNLMQGRTTLVIAHRLSTVTSADRIVVMEGGRITEVGTHSQLLANGGRYRRLYDMQFRL